MKDEVKSSLVLPNKNEQVLFCKMTDEQRELYKKYLNSDIVKEIIKRSSQIFVGLINLRKICNHPHLFNPNSVKNELSKNDDGINEFGYYKKSGKMIVVDALLRLWYNQRHKVLLFSQSRQVRF
jgi:DNA excision repair protein ERCC-6